jgi:alpha,alpha-trehalase
MQVYELSPLFEDVQESRIFPDGKTFVDCLPIRNTKDILADYNKLKNNPAVRFSLRDFIEKNFELPPATPSLNYIQPEKNVVQHIKNLWSCLKREQDSIVNGSSLLPLPHPYIVPGGRFREVYYWDSYFTMLGLKESGETGTIRNMIDNFAFLIHTYGHIPNGNRSYYLSRSQPPFFTLMVELFASIEGASVTENYVTAIEKEYAYWMDGYEKINTRGAYKKLVSLSDGSILNRYFDELFIPRQESWGDDVETASRNNRLKEITYNHLRSAAESGWDFSSRWLANPCNLSTIETADIIPIDLNSLLYHAEVSLSKYFESKSDEGKQQFYHIRATQRQKAIQQYCFNAEEKIYYDYNWQSQKQTGKFTPASLFPLWLLQLKEEEAGIYGKAVAEKIKRELLAVGGVLTSTIQNGEQWDAPNGWAPLQWVTIAALEKTGQPELAAAIAKRWIKLNTDVFERTGKLMEKYNVVDTHLEAGGGEYPGQDGFGWTNGVLLALIEKYGRAK